MMCRLRHAMWPKPKEKAVYYKSLICIICIIYLVYDMKTKQRKKRKRTGGELEKADLSAKDRRTAAITGETAQLRGIPPRNQGDSDARTFTEQYFSFFRNLH